ncbi:hypothetical protein LTS12_027439 [Elasticomyces elasticus]|nr:hypothetical protein LTS12_027439 [Elasticomyces elasticus]
MCTIAASKPNKSSRCHQFSDELVEFSSHFQEPEPPLIKTEFRTAFLQHKWDDQGRSNIVIRVWYSSPSQRLVVINEAFNGAFGSSTFDYSNTTSDGLVDNTLILFSPNGAMLPVYRDYVNSNFPLFEDDMLVKGGTVFSGLVERLLVGQVASWSILYQGAIPLTVFVDACGVVLGYDYWAPVLRTRVVTNFFDTTVGPVDL